MEARNRDLKEWYGKIERSEIKLPRFQRFEAWDRYRICSLMETVIQNLPLGITLVLEVDSEKEQFISRYLETAPQTDHRVLEHLLDGQQRLTALWRMFQNNYDGEAYFVYMKEFDKFYEDNESKNLSVFFRGRYFKSGKKYPLWCDDPEQCLRRGAIPTELLKPEDIQSDIDAWIEKATQNLYPATNENKELEDFFNFKKSISDKIRDLRSIVANYNLPYLSLPPQTDKSVALTVFINMNTNSKPLSTYDIIVAEIESLLGKSLHDLLTGLDKKYPTIKNYSSLETMVLNTSALLQNTLPNQRGAWNMDKKAMVENWSDVERGLYRMSIFLQSEGIYDKQRLPTNAVLAVIAALYSVIPDAGDRRGKDELLLKRYLWFAFFTDRYENSAATHAHADYIALKKTTLGEIKKDSEEAFSISDIPIFSKHQLVDEEELITAQWPKKSTIRGRAILAVANRLGALDFSTGERLDASNIKERHYHHIYPDALLKEFGIPSYLGLNCALIEDKTNMMIGRKDPLKYLTNRYEWTSQEIVKERLHSHLIPVQELANGGYENLTEEEKEVKLKDDFEKFLQKRAKLVMKAVELLSEGHQLNTSLLFDE